MTFDPEKPCTTRDGDSVTILASDLPTKKSLAVVVHSSPQKTLLRYYNNGRYRLGRESRRDIINIPEKRWAVIYAIDGEYGVVVTAHEEILPDIKRTVGAIACLPFSEGDGLD